ncbi:MAG TPA: heme ABC exporter ATP-binding protein CcmA [Bryobacteraceae bacterium]|jgi:heme ABC exporter ATP-binding subunit CcmA|nr:heme ABC exporter ATP-binding protein CcmA [Bryobacteraceae bacterium]
MAAVAIGGVWKYYGDYPALRDITFDVEAGSCIALLGRNGAGKTTLLKIIAGLSRAAKGKIQILNGDARTRAVRRRIGLLGHGIGVYEELSARENLEFFARLQEAPDPRKTAAEWLERTGLSISRDTLVREFSRGMRQRLAVGRAFLHDPELLLLDEPFTALDDRAIELLQNLLSAARARGATIIMSTHQLREALELASGVVLINRGSVGYHGPRTAEMLADPGWLYRHYGEA